MYEFAAYRTRCDILLYPLLLSLNGQATIMSNHMLGVMLKDNLMDGRPSRMKGYGDYTGLVIPPCGEFAPKSSRIEPPPWMPAQSDVGFSHRISLHREIEHFMRYMKLTTEEVALRRDLVGRFTRLVYRAAPTATLRLTGSSATGLYFPTSDIELVITCADEDYEPNGFLAQLADKIRHSSGRFSKNVERFLSVSTPMLRVGDAVTGIEISVVASEGQEKREAMAVRSWIRGEDEVVIRTLVMVLRLFLSIRRLGSTYTGGVNSYLLVWMVVAFVKLEASRPSDQLGGLGGAGEDGTQLSSTSFGSGTSSSSGRTKEALVDLGTPLLGFLHFYGQELDYSKAAILFTPNGISFSLKPEPSSDYHNPHLLNLTDPTNPSIDLGSAAYAIKHVRETFRDGYVSLGALLDGSATRDELVKARFEGALGSFLGGDYSRFVTKRKGILSRWRSRKS
ncbi:poly(A) polymerase Cid14 [Ephemerocybe angulata]|uniref:polynucleotide adenylyltransferase n=1 Tax=Ephemerocybe angulata TaxID=980116 RepID=A0A8H6HKR4_9AGAR|nr:poly(A) polymerase Cid14 [Tulosesus angulatus]